MTLVLTLTMHIPITFDLNCRSNCYDISSTSEPCSKLLSLSHFSDTFLRFMATLAPKSDLSRVLQKIGELNLKQGTSAFSKFGCKNEG